MNASVSITKITGKLVTSTPGLRMLRLTIASVPGDRQAVYLMAVHTGLRRSELGALRWNDVSLDAVKPFVGVRASTTKNGKPAAMYLHPDVVAALRVMRPEDASEDDAVFPHMPRIERSRRDLKKAGITYVDKLGRVADIHSLRKTFGTNLARGGVASRVAMSFIRHSDRRLTDKFYTDESLLSTGTAIETLPSYTQGLSQGVSQTPDSSSHGVSSPVTVGRSQGIEETLVNTGESHAVARRVTSGHDGGNGGSDGARTRRKYNAGFAEIDPLSQQLSQKPVVAGHPESFPDTETQGAQRLAQQELNPPKRAQFPKKTEGTVAPAVTQSGLPDDLGEIIEAWPCLGGGVRAALLTIIRSVSDKPQKEHPVGWESCAPQKGTCL